MEAKTSLRSDPNSFMCLDVNTLQDSIYNNLLLRWSLYLYGSFYFSSFMHFSILLLYNSYIYMDVCECGNEPSGSVKCGEFLD